MSRVETSHSVTFLHVLLTRLSIHWLFFFFQYVNTRILTHYIKVRSKIVNFFRFSVTLMEAFRYFLKIHTGLKKIFDLPLKLHLFFLQNQIFSSVMFLLDFLNLVNFLIYWITWRKKSKQEDHKKLQNFPTTIIINFSFSSITAKIDDDMIRYYVDEDLFLLEVSHSRLSPDHERRSPSDPMDESYDVTLIELPLNPQPTLPSGSSPHHVVQHHVATTWA